MFLRLLEIFVGYTIPNFLKMFVFIKTSWRFIFLKVIFEDRFLEENQHQRHAKKPQLPSPRSPGSSPNLRDRFTLSRTSKSSAKTTISNSITFAMPQNMTFRLPVDGGARNEEPNLLSGLQSSPRTQDGNSPTPKASSTSSEICRLSVAITTSPMPRFGEMPREPTAHTRGGRAEV